MERFRSPRQAPGECLTLLRESFTRPNQEDRFDPQPTRR